MHGTPQPRDGGARPAGPLAGTARPPRGLPRLGAPDGAGAASQLEFNLAHSHDVAVCALASGRQVGVDVERVRPIEGIGQLVAGVFSPAERAAWEALPVEQQLAAFYRCWTRKE
ncbi:MAG: 4'-phosphopantetheinyl transferase superfamily protein, partial [Acetobacteraceae bacterium]|nr:4'-phosphopantetheinyl transferase superfamily protein [Acetobacteraceae bacterium]